LQAAGPVVEIFKIGWDEYETMQFVSEHLGALNTTLLIFYLNAGFLFVFGNNNICSNTRCTLSNFEVCKLSILEPR